MKHNRPAGEPSNYCGVCGVPMSLCDCRQYKEHGAGTTKAGSANADDDLPGKKLGEKENGGGEGGGGKKPFPGAATPLGKKE